MKPNITISIDQLVLHDFAQHDKAKIGAAAEQALARLLAEQGVPPALEQGGAVPYLDGGSFDVASNTPPQVVGAQIAQQVYGGWQPDQRKT